MARGNEESGATRFQSLRLQEQVKAEGDSRRRLVKLACLAVLFVIGTFTSIMALLVGLHLFQVPDLAFLENYNPIQTIQIYDCRDRLVLSLEGSEKRTLVKLSQVSPFMKEALLAAEDHKFYEHNGFRAESIIRALLANMTHGKVVEGGSTITQQLAKNLFFEGEKRTVHLKIAELLVAMNLEHRFSKDKILELYLNEIYFGNGSYGIEQAALNYFGKRSAELSLGESAFLAGIIRAPSTGDSMENRLSASERQQEVIGKMVEAGFISPVQAQMAASQPLYFQPLRPPKNKVVISKYPYYIQTVLEIVKKRYSSAFIERNGLKVYTNLDPVAQDIAEKTLTAGVRRAPLAINQGALVSVRVSDGAVIAMVGGVGDYMQNQWNCATNPHTAGSSFKPFVYLTAFEQKVLDERSYVSDSPMVVKQDDGSDYKPRNFDGAFMGDISVAKAVAYSRNICALRVAQEVGLAAIMGTASRAGITEPLAPHLSLALGCSAVSPLNMAAAYATFARGGEYVSPLLVRRIETRTGKLLRTLCSERYQAFDRGSVAQLVDVLQDVVEHGTGQMAKLKDRPVAGKTGTADQGKDLWFVGFTPDLATAVWAGNKENRPVGGSVTGGTVMASIWRDYHKEYYSKVDIPGGLFVASNRGPMPFAPDRPAPQAVHIADRRVLRPAAKSRRGRIAQAPSRARAPARSAPSGGAIVRSEQGITEYKWGR